MTAYKKVFLDTAPLIYFLEDDPYLGLKTKAILMQLLRADATIASSVISCMEYLVLPYRDNDDEAINAFWEFVNECQLILYTIDSSIASYAANIRAIHRHFKPMDSLQLAAAYVHECDVFITNDKQLRQFEDINVVTVEEWTRIFS